MVEKVPIVMSGLPGDMATHAAEEILKQDDIELIPYALTGDDVDKTDILFGRLYIELYKPKRHRAILEMLRKSSDYSGKNIIIVEFSKGKMDVNGELYADLRYPFVMGSTGGDRKRLEEIVKSSEISAFIAPNFSRYLAVFPLAALQAVADRYHGLLKGSVAKIKESHQSTKADVSGTARAMKPIYEKLGAHVEEIESIRDPEKQLELGVPKDSLGGHAYHWATLTDPTGTVEIGIYTKVNGRKTYAIEVPDIVRFLNQKIKEGSKGDIFTMADYMDHLCSIK